MYINGDNVSAYYDQKYLYSFGVEHIPKESKKYHTYQTKKRLKKYKNTIANTYRIQAYNSIMCEYFCIGFIYFIFKG